mmetsp:Transcript_71307/g.87473  ORF Transcript_71307/g.87473 Transcript_71307/m.87473 type:complete len:203 (+) Transcript_71307:54-662(+)
MATSGLGQRMSRAVTASVLPHSFSSPLDKFQRVGLNISPVSGGSNFWPKRMGEMEKSLDGALPRRRASPLSPEQNGGRSRSKPPNEGPASGMGTPCFGGIDESLEGEDVQDESSKEADTFSPLTQTENDENQVLHPTGKKGRFGETEACIILQRWWKQHRDTQRQLFESLVLELMELRREAALEVQCAWRAWIKRRRENAAA